MSSLWPASHVQKITATKAFLCGIFIRRLRLVMTFNCSTQNTTQNLRKRGVDFRYNTYQFYGVWYYEKQALKIFSLTVFPYMQSTPLKLLRSK